MGTGEGERLSLGYQVEVHGEVKDHRQPFVIGVIGDLSGRSARDRPPWGDRRFLDVDRDNLARLELELGGGSGETWRGLTHLVEALAPDEFAKVRVLDASREELSSVFAEFGGDAWDQSPLFRETYERTYGSFGGESYALLIADYRLGESGDDATIRRELERIGEGALVPVLMPAEGQPEGGIYALAARIGRTARETGWFASLEKPSWADAAGLDFDAIRRLLCTGPFVHLVKSVVRDKIGSFRSGEMMEKWLNLLLHQYVAGSPDEVSLHRPLLEAGVRLTGEHPEYPWIYGTEVRLRPAYRIDEPGPAEVHRTFLPGPRPDQG